MTGGRSNYPGKRHADYATTTPADAARFEAHFYGTDPEPPDFDYAAEAELAEQIKRREARAA